MSGKESKAGDSDETSLLILNRHKEWMTVLSMCQMQTSITCARPCVWSPHRIDIVLVARDLLVVRRARQYPPGCNPAARGLGCAVIP